MVGALEQIYQASDLAGAKRTSFIADALREGARLRSTDGSSLVMLREARLEHVAAIRDYAIAYLTLDVALRRPRAERRAADFGAWAFISVFDDEDIEEFQFEVNDAIIRAASGEELSAVEAVLHGWRMSARTMGDPVAREILRGDTSSEDWVEVDGESAEA